MACTRPDCPPERAVEFVLQEWDIDSVNEVKSLPSYEDQNFRVRVVRSSEEVEYVLKISSLETEKGMICSHPEREMINSKEVLDLQLGAMVHLHDKEVVAPLPLKTRQGQLFTTIEIEGVRCYAHLLTFIPGRMLTELRPHPCHLLYSLGQYLARMDTALIDYPNPIPHRDLHWDLTNAQRMHSFTPSLAKNNQSAQRIEIVQEVLKQFEEKALPKLNSWKRKGLVHNDANAQNVLVDNEGKNIIALIDYGDINNTHYINNVAIAMAYSMLHQENPVEASSHLLKGYHEVFPLLEEEIDVLPTLIKTRFAMSVTMSSHAQLKHPEDEYITIDAKPGWLVLERLSSEVRDEEMVAAYKSACTFGLRKT